MARSQICPLPEPAGREVLVLTGELRDLEAVPATQLTIASQRPKVVKAAGPWGVNTSQGYSPNYLLVITIGGALNAIVADFERPLRSWYVPTASRSTLSLLDEVIAAHGGLDRWHLIETVEQRIRIGGIALPMKGQADPLRETRATVEVGRPRARFESLGVFDSSEPRPPGMARRLRWDRADVLHFAGYALWGYVTAPFFFARDDVEVEELSRHRLKVTFPDWLPVHSRVQTFKFGPDCLIQHLDYTAEVFLGKLVLVRHHCLAHETVVSLGWYPRSRLLLR